VLFIVDGRVVMNLWARARGTIPDSIGNLTTLTYVLRLAADVASLSCTLAAPCMRDRWF
jgi:hypothetical protein